MSAVRQQPTLQNYVQDEEGNTVIPASKRPDGSLRKPIRVRPGYIPQDEIPAYQSPAQMSQPKGATKPIGMPSQKPPQQQQKPPGTAANTGGKGSNKPKKTQEVSATTGVGQAKTTKPTGDDALGRIDESEANPPNTQPNVNRSVGVATPQGQGDEGEWQVVGKKGVAPTNTNNKAAGSVKGKGNAADLTALKPAKENKPGETGRAKPTAPSRDNLKQQNRQMGGVGKGGEKQPLSNDAVVAGTADKQHPSSGAVDKTAKQKQPGNNAAGGGAADKQAKEKSPPANGGPAAHAGIGASQVAPKSTPAGIVLKQNAPDGMNSRSSGAGGKIGSGADSGGAGSSSTAARLRNLKKKLRDIKDLEEKVKAGGVKPNPDQEEKLKKKKQLMSEIKQLESQKASA